MNTLSSPATIIFGLGGTLVDNALDQRMAVNKLLTTMGRRPITLLEAQSMLGDGPETFIARALAATGPPASSAALPVLADRFARFYRGQRVFTHTTAYPGISNALSVLTDHGFQLAVCSNNNGRIVLSILVKLGLDLSFSEVIGGDTAYGRKPSGSPLKVLLSRLNSLPSLAVMIGDRIQDIHAGRRAGLATINVTYGYGRAAHLADATADSPESLPKVINKLRKCDHNL